MLYKQIILEWGQDTESGVWGLGYSPDNGKNFYVLNTTHGRKYRAEDGNRLYPYISDQVQDKIETVVAPAKSAADSAQSAADAAVASAQVTSDVVIAIASATAEAKQGANDAMSRAVSAWDAAQSNVDLIDSNYASASASISSARTEALAAADEAKKSASAAQADIVVVKSSVAAVQADVTATKSDVAVAKSDIADTKTSLTIQSNSLSSYAAQASAEYASTASALSDAKTAFSSDVAEAKSLANTAQITADNAVKSASSVADNLTAVASQAKANSNGITKVTSDVGLLQTTVANNTGDISTIQETAKQIQQAVSDNAGNITVAKQTADSAVTVASDAKSNATVAVQTASQASITASNASGQAASAVITANGAMTTASDAKSNATVAIQTASGASLTATNANSDATVAKQTASEAKVQASNAESDFAQLSFRADKIEANVANNSGAIASVQQTANGLTTTVGNVDNRVKKIEDTTNWTTKTGALDMDMLTTTQNIYYRDTNLTNADGEAGWAYIQVVSVGERVTQTVWHDHSSIQHTRTGAVYGSNSKCDWDAWNEVATNAQVVQVKQTVDGIATIISDPKTGLNATYQTASGNATTISNINGDVSQLKVSASSASVALSDAAGNISSLKATASDLQTKYADAAGDISQIKTDAKGMTQTISTAQGDIANLKTRADGFDAEFATANGNISKLQTDATGTTQTLANTKSDVAVLQSRADGLDAKYADAAGDINTLKTNASGFSQTLTNAQGDISTLKSTVSGVQTTLTDAQGNISTLQSDVSGLKKTTSDNAGNISTLQSTAKTLTSQMSSAQGDISTLKQTASDFSSKVSGMETSLADANGKINDITSNGGGRNLVANTGTDITIDATSSNASNRTFDVIYFIEQPKQGDLITVSAEDTLTGMGALDEYQVVLYNVFTTNERSKPQYLKAGKRDSVTLSLDNLDGDGYTVLLIYAGKAGETKGKKNVVHHLMVEKGTVAHDWSPAPEDTDAKITANATATEQNKKAIALKADQTSVDKISGAVNQLQSSQTVQAGQIQTKVSASDVSGMLTGYATQTYTQSLVTQTANNWNLNLTNLKTDVNAIKTTGGGANLASGTSSEDQSYGDASKTTGWNVAIIATLANPKAGQQYTISVNTRTNGGSWRIQVWYGTSPTQQANWICSESISATQEQKHVLTFTWPSGSNKYLLVQLVNNNDGGQIIWNSVMIEEGTVAHTWSPAPSDMATVTSVTNLSATVDGIKSTVATKADQSTVTQLSNLIQTKVSSDDFNNLSKTVELQTLDSADINTMKTNGHYFVHNLANTPIRGWVYVDVVGNGNDRIRQDVYQDLGNQHCYRRWFGNSWMDWSKSATESEITQLSDAINLRVAKGDVISQINEEAGGNTLIQVSNGNGSLVLDADTTVFTGNAFIPSAAISSIQADKIMLGSSSLWNSDGTLNLVNTKDGTTSKIIATQGNVDFDGTEKNASVIHFASDNNTNAFTITPVGATVTPTLFFERFDQTPGHWLGFTRNETEHEGVMFHTWDDDGERFFVDCHARFDKNLRTIGTLSQGSWNGTPGKPEAGILTIKGGNTIWSGSDFLAIGDHLSNSFTNVMARSFSQQSTLSAKTNIETVDPKDALDLVNQTDIRSYQYKSDVAQGKTKRYTSLIIDDVNDVSQYCAPDEFTNEERTGRDDGSAVGYLFLAVQELTRRIKNLEEKLNG